MGLPDGRTLKFDYTNTHKLGRIALDAHELTEFDYNDKGFESRQRVGALSILKQYDPYGRLSTQEQQHGVHEQSELLAHYHYDTLGRIASIDSAQGSSSFSYDVRGRLAQFKQGLSEQGLSEQRKPNSVIYTHKVGKDNPPPPSVRHNQLTQTPSIKHHSADLSSRTTS